MPGNMKKAANNSITPNNSHFMSIAFRFNFTQAFFVGNHFTYSNSKCTPRVESFISSGNGGKLLASYTARNPA